MIFLPVSSSSHTKRKHSRPFTPFISFLLFQFSRMKSDGRLSSLLLSHDHLYYTQQLLLRDDTIRRGMLSGWEISISFERVYTTECVPLPFSFIHPGCGVDSSSSRLPRCYCDFRREWSYSSDELQLDGHSKLH